MATHAASTHDTSSRAVEGRASELSRSGAGSSVLARWLGIGPVAVVLAAMFVELVLADRKYGLFTGGFGQSRAVDSPAELALFAIGYTASMLFLAIAGWAFARRVTRGRLGWAAVFVFALTNGIVFALALAAQYQLHSYFSDAVGFALLKQLGGGSLVDALLYGLSEIGIALLALAGLAGVVWCVWKLAKRFLPADLPVPRAPSGMLLLFSIAALVLTGWFIPRSGSDAAFGLNRTLGWQILTGSLDLASDVDGDGYGLFAIQHDTAPFDGARHPLALDIPGNGVDEDGFGGDLQLVALPAALPALAIPDGAPHVVVVVMESTRFDVLGKRVGGKPVAPNLERLVVAGDAVAPAYSHVGFTTESLKSIFSGQLAPREGDPSLFRDLDAADYRIGVFSGQAEDFGGIAETVGMRETADTFVDAKVLREKRAFDFAAEGSLLVDEAHLLDAFDSSLGKNDWDKPHFAYFNFQSAHFPYHHDGVDMRVAETPVARADIRASNAQAVRTTYWNAVANADYWLGEVIARLKSKGVWDDTVLIVTGDHGEDLFENGFLGHGHIVNQRQFGTFLATNRPDSLPGGPLALSDYRAIVAAMLTGSRPDTPDAPPFLHIGPLGAPTAIGLAGPGRELTSLRLDTGEACLLEKGRCIPHKQLRGKDAQRVAALVARWGSERWRDHLRD
ncbi:hypothetical protein HME9302_02256 [Alteripontixanthobacter maritimus]|uniref:Sulfatase N-terminal domain-containing protein n=1 Tax=Alteripontixanthobacter maritimus TaxID=2161824 RepID=A0A369QDP2_9SPHN|nr:sulfatase-like hydrolase/transferase [Alteripontixanthobacter maritimus]RDC61039.1 hypothetical protein HME9302_02256 [Alteripontixanthobacter maritimus]